MAYFNPFNMGQRPMDSNLLNGSVLPGNMQNILSQFQQFKNNFHGDPQQMIQQLINSGRISKDQYDRAVQMANEFQKYLK